jgi:hypothetical protein
VAKRGRSLEARRSSSRERRCDRGGRRGFVRASARAGCAWRLPMEDSLDRECARLSRGPRGTGLGGLRAKASDSPQRQPAPTSPEEATGEPEANGLLRARRKKTPSRVVGNGRRSGKRAVKRGSPQSHLVSGGPEPPGTLLRASSDGRRSTPEKTLAWVGTEPQGSGTRAILGRAPQGLAPGNGRCAGKRREHECSSRNGFGVQKSIGRIAAATPEGATKRTPETRDLARTNRQPFA